MNKPHIERLDKEDWVEGITWVCVYNGEGHTSFGYGRNPSEAYKDWDRHDNFDVLEEVFGGLDEN